jgi:DNA-binding YbaB/EbfC family protein
MMKNQMASLMKQAQDIQNNIQKAQAALESVEVEGQAGAGLVKVVMTCHNVVRRVSIDPSLFTDDRDMLEDLLVAAINDATERAKQTSAERMAPLMSGLSLPAGLKMPF